MLVKEFKLREGAKHTHDGQAVQPGDTVSLTKAQAHAFRDKFEPVSNDDFKEVDDDKVPVYKPKAEAKSKEKGKEEEKGATKEAPQGQPVPQPPIHVPGPGNPEGPTDPHTLDPTRQGQQSREQREIIDSGNAPTPAVFAAPNPDAAKRTTAAAPAGATAATEKK